MPSANTYSATMVVGEKVPLIRGKAAPAPVAAAGVTAAHPTGSSKEQRGSSPVGVVCYVGD